jgi:streptogramin lyase
MIGPGGAAGTPAGEDVVTEWLVPFPGSMPFQIAARNDSVFYLTKDVGLHVGRLDVATARFTEWETPYTTTSPGDIQVRASDGSVFIAAATLNEIGQLDVDTSTLTRWALPIDTSAPDATQGPWSLALDAGTAVFFEADDASGSYIGRLDTATGNLLTWRFPGATASRVVVAPDGTVLFNAWNGSGPYQIARLDPVTGVFTSWSLTSQPLFPMVVAPDGSLFFEEASSDFVGVARLVPATGRLTEWRTPALPSDSLSILSGRVYFGADGDLSLTALDPAVAGNERTIGNTVVWGPIAPEVFHLTPSAWPLPVQQTIGTATKRAVQSQTAGGFETWRMATPPRMTASIPGAVYFTEDAYGTIARLEREAAVH